MAGYGRRVKVLLLALLLTVSVVGVRAALPGFNSPAAAASLAPALRASAAAGHASASAQAADPVFAYVANQGSNSVSVVYTATNKVIATIPVGSGPRAVAVSPDGSHVYVANGSSATVSVIDTATNRVTATVPVGNNPNGVAVTSDGTRVYVANAGSGTLSVIATATNTVVETIPAGSSAIAVALSPDGSRAYVANQTSPGTLSVIDTATQARNTIPVGTYPRGVALNPAGSRAYVANSFSSNVSVIDTGTNTVVATIPVGSLPFGVVVTPDGGHVYVANQGSGNVSVIDTATNSAVANIPVGSNPYGVAVTRDGSYVYVTNYASNTVSVIATASNTVVATTTVGSSPFSVAIGPAITVPEADLGLSKTVDNTAPTVGQDVTFTVTLTNNGPDTATGVTVQDSLPLGLTFVSATPSGTTSYDSASGVWTVGTVAAGGTETLKIVARVIASGSFTNTATIANPDQIDLNPDNNTASATVTTPTMASKVLAWGDNTYGQLGVPTSELCDGTLCSSTPLKVQGLPPNDPPIMVSAGDFGSTVLTRSGQVWAFGENGYGQLGAPSSTLPRSTTPVPVQGLPPAIAIASGDGWNMALTASGQVWAWGWGVMLGNGCDASTLSGPIDLHHHPEVRTCPDSSTPVQVQGLPMGDPVTQISAADPFALALTKSGKVYGWGSGGALGDGTTTTRTTAVPACTTADTGAPCSGNGLPAGDPVISIAGAVDGSHGLAATASGKVFAWGSNDAGQLGNPTITSSSIPIEVQGLPAADPVVQVRAGEDHSLALTESGIVFAWGDNDSGQLGNGTNPGYFQPTPVPAPVQGLPTNDPVAQISAGSNHNLALTLSGQIWAWGDNRYGQLGRLPSTTICNEQNPTFWCSSTAIQVPLAPGDPITQVAAGGDEGHSLALNEPEPTLELTKALSGSRVNPGDQFTVQIKDATGTVVSDETNATTAGSGSTITSGTGTTGLFIGTADSTYQLTEAGADLSHYTQTITCKDVNQVQSDLPDNAALNGSFAITPVLGAAISCTITNTAGPGPSPSPSPSPSPGPSPGPSPSPAPSPSPSQPGPGTFPSQPGLPNTGALPRHRRP